MNDGTFFGFQMMMMGNKRKLKLLSNGGRGKNLNLLLGYGQIDRQQEVCQEGLYTRPDGGLDEDYKYKFHSRF